MPNETDTKTPVTKAPDSFPMPVHEFCLSLSKTEKHPEMIYAFSKDEAAKGHNTDTADNFQARYAAFCGRVTQ